MGTHIIIDTHVHAHKVHEIANLLDSAYSNFLSQASKVSNNDFIGVLFVYALKENDNVKSIFSGEGASGSWIFKQIDDITIEASIVQKKLLIKTGYQVISREGIEILILADSAKELYGKDMEVIIESALNQKSLVILPWGVGKWLGNRGKIINQVVQKFGTRIFLGDNSARPWFWQVVPQFKLAKSLNVKILNGSDPLPVINEERIVGASGVLCQQDNKEDLNLFELLSNQTSRNYGKMESAYRFFINQIKLRLSQGSKG